MKRTGFILAVVLCSSVNFLFAQLRIAENTNVAIQTTETPLSPLTIGGTGAATEMVSITSPYQHENALKVHLPGHPIHSNSMCIAIKANTAPFPGKSAGILGQAYSASYVAMPATNYGVIGIAGNGTSNYGILGTLYGSAPRGGAIVGTVDNEQTPTIDGKYAGFFSGNVKVTGTLNGVIISSSDIRYKKDIRQINSQTALGNVLQMNPVEYKLKEEPAIVTQVEELSETPERTKSIVYDKTQYGLIAQELQELYPDLVYEQDNGYLAINYTGLIPLLIQSIKELNEKVEKLSAATGEQ